MIFYEVEKYGGHYLVATQADAKREAREQKCTWAQVDIPTDKAGLMAYINEQRRIYPCDVERDEDEMVFVDEAASIEPEHFRALMAGVPQSSVAVADYDRPYEATEIEDFILNRASVQQVANIHSCLGTRFGELAKEQRLTSLLD